MDQEQDHLSHSSTSSHHHRHHQPDNNNSINETGLPCQDRHLSGRQEPTASLGGLPTELLLHILTFVDVCDLLNTARVNRLLRSISLAPILHRLRLRRCRRILPGLLFARPRAAALDALVARSVFLTHTAVVSRRLSRSLVCIRLDRRLRRRPAAATLVERAVLPGESVPPGGGGGGGGGDSRPFGKKGGHVAPGIVAARRAVEWERVRDHLREWVKRTWSGEVRAREERMRRVHESRGVGRVWRLKRFWERVVRGENTLVAVGG